MRKLKTRLNLLIMRIATHFLFGKELRKRYEVVNTHWDLFFGDDGPGCSVSYIFCLRNEKDSPIFSFLILLDVDKNYKVNIMKSYKNQNSAKPDYRYIHVGCGHLISRLKSAREFIIGHWRLLNVRSHFNSSVLGGEDE